MLGVIAHLEVLMLERVLQRITEELAYVGDGLELHAASSGDTEGRFCKLRRSFIWQSERASAEVPGL